MEAAMQQFYHLFSEWKSKMQMESEIKTRAIEKIESLLEKRTEGIMKSRCFLITKDVKISR